MAGCACLQPGSNWVGDVPANEEVSQFCRSRTKNAEQPRGVEREEISVRLEAETPGIGASEFKKHMATRSACWSCRDQPMK